ncbi:transposase [Rhizobium oryziradicis]|uniref:Transposase DDE domain-containing protein n=1 Tax=Rhizobium oryziradicis TaxID=1867956 RepID=A0A1Q8ZVY0_9HYPH|nr:transposase [Rhizobium oryziradicis]OLP46175.1 hypothetical protein BJF95_03205 [Rhizobium oryziradicis]
MTVWVSDAPLSEWSASLRASRGGQPKYSSMAIAMCLDVRTVYDLPLRQTQGLMRSIAALMGVEIAVPAFSALSRRDRGWYCPQ